MWVAVAADGALVSDTIAVTVAVSTIDGGLSHAVRDRWSVSVLNLVRAASAVWSAVATVWAVWSADGGLWCSDDIVVVAESLTDGSERGAWAVSAVDGARSWALWSSDDIVIITEALADGAKRWLGGRWLSVWAVWSADGSLWCSKDIVVVTKSLTDGSEGGAWAVSTIDGAWAGSLRSSDDVVIVTKSLADGAKRWARSVAVSWLTPGGSRCGNKSSGSEFVEHFVFLKKELSFLSYNFSCILKCDKLFS